MAAEDGTEEEENKNGKMKQKPINWYMYMKYESFFRNYKIASLSIDQFILSRDFDLFRILYYANILWCMISKHVKLAQLKNTQKKIIY